MQRSMRDLEAILRTFFSESAYSVGLNIDGASMVELSSMVRNLVQSAYYRQLKEGMSDSEAKDIAHAEVLGQIGLSIEDYNAILNWRNKFRPDA